MPRIYKLFNNPIDTEQDPLTYEKLIKWLIQTKWVEGRVRSVMSPLDKIYEEDYIQEIWVQILSVPHDKLLSIYHKGKGKFVNYIKSIIANNCYSVSSPLYKKIRECRKGEIYLEDGQWTNLMDSGDVDIEIHFPQVKNHKVYFESEIQNMKSEIKLYEP